LGHDPAYSSDNDAHLSNQSQQDHGRSNRTVVLKPLFSTRNSKRLKENDMKNYNAVENQTTRRNLLIACVTALTMAFTASLPHTAHAHPKIEPPPVPTDLQPPEGHKAFLVGHAIGSQQYFCKFSDTSFAWTQFGP
jgi:hypothetical protein